VTGVVNSTKLRLRLRLVDAKTQEVLYTDGLDDRQTSDVGLLSPALGIASIIDSSASNAWMHSAPQMVEKIPSAIELEKLRKK
jgi:curli biogenesis system outer membrane secretion channel CsgG